MFWAAGVEVKRKGEICSCKNPKTQGKEKEFLKWLDAQILTWNFLNLNDAYSLCLLLPSYLSLSVSFSLCNLFFTTISIKLTISQLVAN